MNFIIGEADKVATNNVKMHRQLAGLELPVDGHKSFPIQDSVRLRKIHASANGREKKKVYSVQAKHK